MMDKGKQLADNFVLNARAVRRRKGIRQDMFAKRLGMSARMLESIELGKTAIKLHDAINTADALETDFMTLLKGCIQDVED